MSTGLHELVVAPGEDTVEVEVTLPVGPLDVWSAITDREALSRWFGTLRSELVPGQTNRLEFGDGDFFDVTVLCVRKPEVLRYSWRFMGTSPLDTITWTLRQEGPWCRLRVADWEAGRPLEENVELGEGWRDFLTRLQVFLSTGRPSRYDWREDIDVTIELPHPPEAAFDRLLSREGLERWLPLEGPFLPEGTRLALPGTGTPASLRVGSIAVRPPEEVSFLVEGPGASGGVDTRIALSRRGSGSVLQVHQGSWKRLSIPDEDRRELRARSARLWVTAVRKAQACVGVEIPEEGAECPDPRR